MSSPSAWNCIPAAFARDLTELRSLRALDEPDDELKRDLLAKASLRKAKARFSKSVDGLGSFCNENLIRDLINTMDLSQFKPTHLRRIRSLATLDEAQLALFLPFVELVSFKRHEPIFKEGDAGDSMYLVLEGRVRITVRKLSTDAYFLRILEAGNSFGEVAVIDGGSRSATAEADEDSLLVRISKDALTRLITNEPGVAAKFLFSLCQTLGMELRDLTKRLRSAADLGEAVAHLK